MLIKTNNKWDAVRAMINTLLKDRTVYCNECGQDYNENARCCKAPHIGRHADFVQDIIHQNKDVMATRLNETGSTKDKALRWGLSLPPRFLMELETAFKSMYNEKLFKDAHEMRRFMKEFPAFATCSKV
jgi:hypothetical protein